MSKYEEQPTESLGKQLISAVKANDEAEVSKLLESKVDVNYSEESGNTALYYAVNIGNEAIVRLLLEKKDIDVNKANEDGFTPLHAAAESGNETIVRLLLAQKDINVFCESKDGLKPQDFAKNEGHTEIIALLEKHATSHPEALSAPEAGGAASSGFVLGTNDFDVKANLSLFTALLLSRFSKSVPCVAKIIEISRETSDSLSQTPVEAAGAAAQAPKALASKPIVTIESLREKLASEKAKGSAASDRMIKLYEAKISDLLTGSAHARETAGAASSALNTSDSAPNFLSDPSLRAIAIKLFAFVERGKYAEVKKLLSKEGYANLKDDDGSSLLHYAAALGHANIVELLLDKGAKIDATNSIGAVALHFAAKHGHTNIVELLLADKRVDVNATTEGGLTALYIAGENNHKAIVKLLLADKRVDVNATTEGGLTALYIAGENNHKAIVKLLLADKRVDVNATTKDGATALNYAACNGHVAIVKLLLADKRVDVNLGDSEALTPLIYAAKQGHTNIVELLLDRGAKIDATSKLGAVALHFTAMKGHANIVELLLARNASVDIADIDNWQALHFAARSGFKDIVKLLLAHPHVDVNATNNGGFKPLHIAAAKGHEAVVKLLLAHPHVDVNAARKDGWTPLHFAARHGNISILKLLLAKKDINLNSLAQNEAMLLFHAKEHGDEAAVKYLLDEGASLDDTIREMSTPLQIALKKGHTEFAKLLSTHEARHPEDTSATEAAGATAYQAPAIMLLADKSDREADFKKRIELIKQGKDAKFSDEEIPNVAKELYQGNQLDKANEILSQIEDSILTGSDDGIKKIYAHLLAYKAIKHKNDPKIFEKSASIFASVRELGVYQEHYLFVLKVLGNKLAIAKLLPQMSERSTLYWQCKCEIEFEKGNFKEAVKAAEAFIKSGKSDTLSNHNVASFHIKSLLAIQDVSFAKIKEILDLVDDKEDLFREIIKYTLEQKKFTQAKKYCMKLGEIFEGKVNVSELFIDVADNDLKNGISFIEALIKLENKDFAGAFGGLKSLYELGFSMSELPNEKISTEKTNSLVESIKDDNFIKSLPNKLKIQFAKSLVLRRDIDSNYKRAADIFDSVTGKLDEPAKMAQFAALIHPSVNREDDALNVARSMKDLSHYWEYKSKIDYRNGRFEDSIKATENYLDLLKQGLKPTQDIALNNLDSLHKVGRISEILAKAFEYKTKYGITFNDKTDIYTLSMLASGLDFEMVQELESWGEEKETCYKNLIKILVEHKRFDLAKHYCLVGNNNLFPENSLADLMQGLVAPNDINYIIALVMFDIEESVTSGLELLRKLSESGYEAHNILQYVQITTQTAELLDYADDKFFASIDDSIKLKYACYLNTKGSYAKAKTIFDIIQEGKDDYEDSILFSLVQLGNQADIEAFLEKMTFKSFYYWYTMCQVDYNNARFEYAVLSAKKVFEFSIEEVDDNIVSEVAHLHLASLYELKRFSEILDATYEYKSKGIFVINTEEENLEEIRRLADAQDENLLLSELSEDYNEDVIITEAAYIQQMELYIQNNNFEAAKEHYRSFSYQLPQSDFDDLFEESDLDFVPHIRYIKALVMLEDGDEKAAFKEFSKLSKEGYYQKHFDETFARTSLNVSYGNTEHEKLVMTLKSFIFDTEQNNLVEAAKLFNTIKDQITSRDLMYVFDVNVTENLAEHMEILLLYAMAVNYSETKNTEVRSLARKLVDVLNDKEYETEKLEIFNKCLLRGEDPRPYFVSDETHKFIGDTEYFAE